MRPTFFRQLVHLFFLLVFEGESCWSSPSTATAAAASVAGSVDLATGCSLSALSVDAAAVVVAATADVVGSSELAEPNRIIWLGFF